MRFDSLYDTAEEYVEQSREYIDERRGRLIQRHMNISGDEIIRVEHIDTGECDYTPVWTAHPDIIESAVHPNCDNVSLIDEAQYLSEDV